jgi:pilus assembly protein CpaF
MKMKLLKRSLVNLREAVTSAFAKTQERLRVMNGPGQFHEDHFRVQNSEKFKKWIEESLEGEDLEIRERICSEYFSWGPLTPLLAAEDVTEILVNGPSSIWFERGGVLFRHPDAFLSEVTYLNCFHRMCEAAHCQSTVETPASTGLFLNFRLTVIRQELTGGSHHLSLRRHPANPWTLQRLEAVGWATPAETSTLGELIRLRKNFLIVGGTGSGKTSLINALLQMVSENERAVVIEDTPEIELPNTSSMKLLTRQDPQGILKPIDQGQLLCHSLRLRPDRLVLGEIRGGEAKDLLMALATGHSGSFGSLHASDARQALIRLEMLIQMGAPAWSLPAVRRLIQLSLEYILLVGKSATGERRFHGIYKICSLEENGFLIEKVTAIS